MNGCSALCGVDQQDNRSGRKVGGSTRHFSLLSVLL